MGVRVQVVLGDKTFRLLKDLARPRAGNQSFVVREALRYFAEREEIERTLDAVLAQRGDREAMDAGLRAQREGRLWPHRRVVHGGRPRRSRR